MNSDRRPPIERGAEGAPLRDHDLKRGLGSAFGVRKSPLRPAGRWLDTNLGGSGILRDELRHIFPDSWAFFLGEIALYCFIVLVATGIFLTLFFQASEAPVVYEGSYAPLAGAEVSAAYDSVLGLSLDVPAGLLVRQVHHWAALVFVGALIIHLLRMFLTAAYRRPRRLNWLFGFTLLILVGLNGLFGYSLPDDLLSGTGLRIAYSITESIPFIGAAMATLLFGGEFPTGAIIGRIYPVHIFLLPAGIAGLLGAHLGLLWMQRHTQFPGPGRSDRTVVGTPMVPAYALRTTGYLLLVAGICTAFGAFVQINPVWLYGPYRAWDATTAAQPDWYMGWLEGAVRMMPGWDIQIGGLLIPAIFWPAVILPGLIFTPLALVPWIDWATTRDGDFHNVLMLPGQHPARTAWAAGFVTFLSVLLVAGGNDVFAFVWGWSQPTLLYILQWLTVVLPPVVALVTYAIVRVRARRWASTARGARRTSRTVVQSSPAE
jgi:ubiquinol-cytochrome c reductase cytochrome b subunit